MLPLGAKALENQLPVYKSYRYLPEHLASLALDQTVTGDVNEEDAAASRVRSAASHLT